ncbi:hypothetical protein ACFQZS_03475 [Mucilaginibacter calamicampi]|uniref:Uncharacterized protein n=1 Tax=Mucilaginibacter calamicampi TaxID=1302352 RepID=A0ABW2YV72_9SPHI
MFPDYQAQVLLTYHKKREANELSLILLHPTPGKLRDECLAVLHDRFLKKDEKTLKAFFGPKSSEVDYMQLIRKFDADKFRPLVSYLKGKTDSTEDKNVELLAWLIDYEPRPYQFRPPESISVQKRAEIKREEPKEVPDQAKALPLIATTDRPENSVTQVPKTANKKRVGSVMILVIALVIVIGGTYILWTINQPTAAHSLTSQLSGACMYWSEDHYEPIPCNQKSSGRLVLALDTLKVNHFKLIRENDTVSPNSIGKVWYFKTGKGLELYTDSGFHPVHIERRLRPLSRYMWDKYLSPKWIYN